MAKKHGLLDGAKTSEVDWSALAPIAQNAVLRGGCESWVYFIAEVDCDGPVKIGVAKNPISRRRGMQTGNPKALRVERAIFGDKITEGLIHKALSSDRVAGTTEWFSARKTILDVALEISRRQAEAPMDTDMEGMTLIAVEAISELGREIRLGDEVRLLARGVGYSTRRLKVV